SSQGCGRITPVMNQVASRSMAARMKKAGSSRRTKRRTREFRGIRRSTRPCAGGAACGPEVVGSVGTINVEQIAKAAHRLDAHARAVQPLAQTVDVDFDRILA